jgi:hypothetical protein
MLNQMARELKTDQDYKNKLLKLTPSEIVAAYILIGTIVVTLIMHVVKLFGNTWQSQD